jgi:hypothetical protein
MRKRTMKATMSKETIARMKKPMMIESHHLAMIKQIDKKSDVWVDTMTLALELQVSPFTWSGLLLPEVEKHYGDRNLFRRVHGRRALWNFSMIHRWYLRRKSPKAGFKPRYLQRLEARGSK